MPRINVPDDLGGWMALRPDMAPGLVALSDAVYGKSKLPLRVQEIARMRIALANQCEVCRNARYAEGADEGMDEAFYANVAQWRTAPEYSAREKLAAEYAEGIALDHIALRENDDFWKRLRQHFRDEEIVDLAFCCTLWLGAGRTMRVLDVGQTCSLVMSRRETELAGAAHSPRTEQVAQRKSEEAQHGASMQAQPGAAMLKQPGFRCAPPGLRTADPLTAWSIE